VCTVAKHSLLERRCWNFPAIYLLSSGGGRRSASKSAKEESGKIFGGEGKEHT
jgi:hypothetical protein